MKTRNMFLVALGMALGGVASTQAAINLTQNGLGYGFYNNISVTYPTDYTTGTGTRSLYFAGEIKMKPTSGPDLVTFCLSPAGNLNNGLYDSLTFDAAKSGNNPTSWATDGGIENASYLWYAQKDSITTAAQGAAMQLALWELLYDSTDSGSITGGGSLTGGRFTAAGTGVADSAFVTAFNAYMSQITTAGGATIDSFYSTHPGYVLRPQDAGGQDLLTSITPVPEPGTWLAALALFLPFGAGSLRLLRKRLAV